MNKKEIRKLIIEKRDSISIYDKSLKDDKIKSKLRKLDIYRKCKNIFVYIGFGSEIDTTSFIEEFIKDDKNIFVPKTDTDSKKMEAVKISSLNKLEKNKYGILEPTDNSNVIEKDKIDLVILPGVAFDITGGRIGYGGGYYDRYLKDINNDIPKIALAYDFQILERLPIEEHDIKADYIITEDREINLLHYTRFSV